MNTSDCREGALSGHRGGNEIVRFWLHHVVCRILIPRWGIEPGPSAVKGLSPNHWTVRKFLDTFLKCQCSCLLAMSLKFICIHFSTIYNSQTSTKRILKT